MFAFEIAARLLESGLKEVSTVLVKWLDFSFIPRNWKIGIGVVDKAGRGSLVVARIQDKASRYLEMN